MMENTFLLAPIVVPVLFWAAYHWHADRRLPEPPSHLALAFVLGIGAWFLGGILYEGLAWLELRRDAYALGEASLSGLLAYSMLAIGLVEEGAKLVPFVLFLPLFRELDEPIDGIIYGSFVALGFAAAENVHYLQFMGPAEAYARGFASPVVHIVFASIWAYVVGRAWIHGRPLLRPIAVSLVFSASLHGLYDFIVIGLPPRLLPASALLIAGAWIWRLRLLRDLRAAA